MRSSLLALVICASLSGEAWCLDPLVLTGQGLVRGTRSADGDYSMFLGIPFASVDPENPFGDATPPPVFKDVYDANDDSAICPQDDFKTGGLVGSLDCLQLNVFVPSHASSTNPLPVMVWIYGGGFNGGTKQEDNFGPQFLIQHGVVLVTLNYRVGPYGFMCLDIPSVPGNAGLKDQQAGLRWVRDNIAAFGGDATSITAFGQSAGGMSVEFQILSSGSNGLFHRAIIESGTALVEALVVHSRPTAPVEIAKYLGYQVEEIEKALKILANVSSDDVVKAGKDLGITFKPCIEKQFEGVDNFMIDYPDYTLGSGQYESVPMIIGFNSHEQLSQYVQNRDNEAFFQNIQNIFYDRINASFAFVSETQLESAAKIVEQFYIGNQPVNKDVLYELSAFDSDVHFVHPIDRSVTYHLAKSNQPIYQYLFAYHGDINSEESEITEGAVHGGEIAYLFKQIDTPQEINSEDQLMIARMTTMWTNFAKYGKPTVETSDLLPVDWPAVSQGTRDYLYIDKELKVYQKPVHDRIAFWDLFFLSFGDYFRMVW